jgi:hypothetical protein
VSGLHRNIQRAPPAPRPLNIYRLLPRIRTHLSLDKDCPDPRPVMPPRTGKSRRHPASEQLVSSLRTSRRLTRPPIPVYQSVGRRPLRLVRRSRDQNLTAQITRRTFCPEERGHDANSKSVSRSCLIPLQTEFLAGTTRIHTNPGSVCGGKLRGSRFETVVTIHGKIAAVDKSAKLVTLERPANVNPIMIASIALIIKVPRSFTQSPLSFPIPITFAGVESEKEKVGIEGRKPEKSSRHGRPSLAVISIT